MLTLYNNNLENARKQEAMLQNICVEFLCIRKKFHLLWMENVKILLLLFEKFACFLFFMLEFYQDFQEIMEPKYCFYKKTAFRFIFI